MERETNITDVNELSSYEAGSYFLTKHTSKTGQVNYFPGKSWRKYNKENNTWERITHQDVIYFIAKSIPKDGSVDDINKFDTLSFWIKLKKWID